MDGRGRQLAGALILWGMLAQPAFGGQEGSDTATPSVTTAPAPTPPKLPKAIPVAPGIMPALPTAVIDDTLAIGGEDINARKVRSRMTVGVNVNGSGPYRFVVDSGADSTVIGRKVATALALPIGSQVTLNGMTGTSLVPRVIVDELRLGVTDVYNLELPVLADGDLGGEGMLGIDALNEQRLMLDFEKRVITVEDATKPPPRMDGEIVVTARRKRGQLILTQATANGHAVDAVIDTGSEITIGNSALRQKLFKRSKDKLMTVEVIGVTGEVAKLEMVVVKEIRVGAIIMRDVPIAFADVPPFGVFGLSQDPALLLGTDLMENFRRISLDFRHRKVRFQLRKCAETGITLRTSANAASRLSMDKEAPEVCRR